MRVRVIPNSAAAHLREGGLSAQVQVPAEVTAAADDLRKHVGTTGVSELGLLRELAHVHQAKQVPVQLVHLVCDVRVQRQNLQRKEPVSGMALWASLLCQDWESLWGTLTAAVPQHHLTLPFPAGRVRGGEPQRLHQWFLSVGPSAQRPCPDPKSRGLRQLQGTLGHTTDSFLLTDSPRSMGLDNLVCRVGDSNPRWWGYSHASPQKPLQPPARACAAGAGSLALVVGAEPR